MWANTLSDTLPWEIDSLRIRALGADDAELFAQTQYGSQADVDALKEAIISGKGSIPTLYVAEMLPDDLAIGVCGFATSASLGITDVSIKLLPEYRCAGYGRKLLAELRDRWFKILVETKLCATVKPDNRKAIAILEACGFTFVRTFADHLREEKCLYCCTRADLST